MIKQGDKLIYIGESNDDFYTGQEVILTEELSPEAVAGMKNTPDDILVHCMYFCGKGFGKRSVVGFKLIKLSELTKKIN